MRVIQVFSQGPQGIPGPIGPQGPQGPAGSSTAAGPFFIKADQYNTWFTTSSILISSSLQIQSDEDNLLTVNNSTGSTIFTVTQSGYVVIATQSMLLTNPAPYGGIYFTSSSFFVGLE
jgi:hypothetical protein